MADKIIHKTIAAALASAQGKMGKALKGNVNPAFKSRYADLAAVMDACMEALNGEGIAVIQPTGEDETGRYVETILLHGESGQTLSCRVPLIVSKNDMQGYGSAVTYARRYGLMCMAGVAADDDDGNAAAAAAPKQADPPKRKEAPDAHVTASEALMRADTLEQLQAIWGDLPRAVQGHGSVIAAKDKRKAELLPSLDDAIPY